MAMMPPTVSAMVTPGGTPNSMPTPAMPLSSVMSAPMQAMASVETESHAQPRPKRSRMSAPWPRPVTRPSRTVSSCTTNRIGTRTTAAAAADSPTGRRSGRR